MFIIMSLFNINSLKYSIPLEYPVWEENVWIILFSLFSSSTVSVLLEESCTLNIPTTSSSIYNSSFNCFKSQIKGYYSYITVFTYPFFTIFSSTNNFALLWRIYFNSFTQESLIFISKFIKLPLRFSNQFFIFQIQEIKFITTLKPKIINNKATIKL